jgi:hypothetical protein
MELVLLAGGFVAVVALIIYNRWRRRYHSQSIGGVSYALFECQTHQALQRLQKQNPNWYLFHPRCFRTMVILMRNNGSFCCNAHHQKLKQSFRNFVSILVLWRR